MILWLNCVSLCPEGNRVIDSDVYVSTTLPKIAGRRSEFSQLLPRELVLGKMNVPEKPLKPSGSPERQIA